MRKKLLGSLLAAALLVALGFGYGTAKQSASNEPIGPAANYTTI